MDIPIQIVLTVASIVITLVLAYFGFVKDVVHRLTVLETDSKVFWQIIGPSLAKIIHSPDHKQRDELVDKLFRDGLSVDEARILDCLLEVGKEESDNGHDKLIFAFVQTRVKQILANARKK
jgi:hypothetical protein